MPKSHSHTLCVRTLSNEPVGPECRFESKPRETGKRWNIHPAELLKRLENKTVRSVVKVSTARGLGSTDKAKAQVDAEVKKYGLLEEVLRNRTDRVSLVPTYLSAIDKVGRGGKAAWKQRKGSLSEGEDVLVQEAVKGKVRCLLDIGGGSPSPASSSPSELVELVHESYRLSQGSCVIASMKGVEVRKNGVTFYRVTSLTVHSRRQKYGSADLGVQGVRAYEEWGGLCSSPSTTTAVHRQPSAPPLEQCDDDDDCPDAGLWLSQKRTLDRFQVRPVEDQDPFTPWDWTRLVNMVGSKPETRTRLPEIFLNLILGPPPSYSTFTGAA